MKTAITVIMLAIGLVVAGHGCEDRSPRSNRRTPQRAAPQRAVAKPTTVVQTTLEPSSGATPSVAQSPPLQLVPEAVDAPSIDEVLAPQIKPAEAEALTEQAQDDSAKLRDVIAGIDEIVEAAVRTKKSLLSVKLSPEPTAANDQADEEEDGEIDEGS